MGDYKAQRIDVRMLRGTGFLQTLRQERSYDAASWHLDSGTTS